MKKAKTNLILKLVLFAAAIFTVLVIFQNVEGFQAGTVVTLNYGIGTDLKPILISSSNPGVTGGSTAVGTATVNVSTALGKLKRYTGFGWSTNKWLPLAAAKLDRGVGTLFLTSGGKTIHNPNYTGVIPNGSQTEIKLPTTGLAYSTLTMNNLYTSTFPVVGAGDSANQNSSGVRAKIRIVLTF